MTVQVTGNLAKFKQLIEQIKASGEKAVYVGFPAEFNEKVEGSDNFNLASLAAVLEFGNERIPSRPFLRQTLTENQEKYTALFVKLFESGVSIDQIYEQIALIAQGDVQQNIVNGKWTANAPSTIKRKKSSKPLIDTGKLRQSVKGIVK
jgi:hypothetical protein|nr:MAG TPA: virion morphogenesis protein [Caudoviricetes sp.]DAY25197.1 MAG TPA: virion morphogenesis protein [Caudoviricetes sp.]